MSEAKRKLLGLFRSRSASDTSPKDSKVCVASKLQNPPAWRDRDKEKENEKEREKEKDIDRKSRRPSNVQSPSRRPPRSQGTHSPASRPAERESIASNASAPSQRPILTKWPPVGFASEASLSQGKAMELIASGVPVFKGCRRPVPNFPEAYNLYATCEGSRSAGSDRATPFNAVFNARSFRLRDSDLAQHPWETLEQPSMSFCYGTRPGTITLNHWVTSFGKPNPAMEFVEPDVKPREVKLSTILERLIYLQGGFEEGYEDLMYKNLYTNLLKDPDRILNPHMGMETQIADLITVLSRREWIDFSAPKNQVVSKFFTNATYTDNGGYKTFFHQLLLSLELDFRIHSKYHAEGPKEKLLSQLPPRIAWDLALARRWKESISIEKFSTGDPEQIRFHLKAKKSQVKALRRFARIMKWPNLVKVDNVLKERDPDAKALEDRSSDAMSYFTGVILPGGTLPWLCMNVLIDCDDDIGPNSLAALTHMHPNSGFQYKGTTYWSSTSIVGKVLAPESQEVGGWVGPARPAPDLSRIGQVVRIRQRRPKQTLNVSDVESMMERSDPLGPPSTLYPIAEYQLLQPEAEDFLNTVRIEKLALKPTSYSASDSQNKLLTYDAAVQFAIDGRSWPLRLSYDVSFISAFPCSRGPHPLFFDYVFKSVKVEDILTIKHWGEPDANASIRATSSTGAGTPSGSAASKGGKDEVEDENESEKVLVVEAFGVCDNEVLARAWCSHWGLSAVVADVERTCMACAIREAYAACVNVVILVDGLDDDKDDL
ncbi:hypothetical protein LSUE1_G000233 [Lachnellula suecica]|uniref:Vtc domain-containing protein n=1 Tax=Lachnellula suecica TaxID=602035 RepID=A0A8T9CIX7_9HELO|nr:hypothetical protein LSUE1_G000233 [Lachnellula suecica]